MMSNWQLTDGLLSRFPLAFVDLQGRSVVRPLWLWFLSETLHNASHSGAFTDILTAYAKYPLLAHWVWPVRFRIDRTL